MFDLPVLAAYTDVEWNGDRFSEICHSTVAMADGDSMFFTNAQADFDFYDIDSDEEQNVSLNCDSLFENGNVK